MPMLEASTALPDALRAILKLMESNIEEPLPIDDLAHYAQVSRRQIDRLFHRYMKTTPSRYYLELRVTRARRLLLQTSAPITSIAITRTAATKAQAMTCAHTRTRLPVLSSVTSS